MRSRIAVFLVLTVAIRGAALRADEVDGKLRTFFATYCSDCHGAETQEADFRVDTMLRVSQTAVDAEYWQLVVDNLYLGEMPPEGEKQPSDAEREVVTDWIDSELRRARRVLAGHSDEVVLRRLNRTEYEYTIEDLFEVRGDLTSGFPADATVDGFDNNGAALMLSSEQISQYMQAAEFVLDRAIVTTRRPETKSVTFTLHDFNQDVWANQARQLQRNLDNFESLTPNVQARTKEMQKQNAIDPYSDYRFPALIDGKLAAARPEMGPETDAVLAVNEYNANTPSTRRVFRTREAGWYRFSITAYAFQTADQPVQLKVSYGSFRQGTLPKIAGVISLADSTPRDYEFRVYLQPNEQVQFTMTDGQSWTRPGTYLSLDTPMVAVRSATMEGPIIEEWPPRGHQILLGKRDAGTISDGDIPEILTELAPRLFRRPVKDSVVQEFVEFYSAARGQQEQTLDAFKLTVKAMLASPHFVYHVEPAQTANNRATSLPIDQYALANRLSYFLWRSLPDAELYRLAAAGRLTEAEVIRQQVDRLLADPKSERFLTDFVGQWLDIDRVGEMQPDGNLYPEYDADLERAMVEETQSFVRELLQKDESLINLIDSDWAMLNGRLARHYGIPDVSGNEFRRVSLDKSASVRGGLLSQASILNMTSNGTTTSPVVRGVWILERMLGTPVPPPPPDVPAIEPDIRGASTIQEQLEKHRSIRQCASCHRRIDPYGIALENFDVIGGWRETYRALEPTANPRRPKLVDGPIIISSGNLPRHGGFKGFRQFRQLLLQQKDLVFLNMARQLATFALGRTMSFSDEEDLHRISESVKNRDGGFQTMIRELAASELFKRP